jgi:hypothetical protein
MSDSSFPFQGQAVADAPAAEPESSGDRTRLLVLVGLVAVLLLGAAAYFFLFSGGDDSDDLGAGTPAPVPAAPADPPSTDSTPVKKEKISAKSFGRDPFEALIVEPVASTGDAATSGEGAGAESTGGTAAGESGDNGDSGSAPTAPSPATAHTFKVTDVAPDNSTVTVKLDGETYRNLRAGEVFAEVFKVRFIGGSVNSFQIGDEVFNVAGGKKVTIAG